MLPIGTLIIYNETKFDWQYGWIRPRRIKYVIGYIIGYECYRENTTLDIYVVQDRDNGSIHWYYIDDECIEIYQGI